MAMSAAFMAFFGFVGTWFSPSNFHIERVKSTAAFAKTELLQQFESEFLYPFSATEEFRIKHGRHGNYLAFFKSLGTPYYFVATAKEDQRTKKTIDGKTVIINQKKGEIAAAACAVLRSMPTHSGKKTHAWYICDLKVNKKYQGDHLPLAITKEVGFWRFLQCPRGFAICMNPPVGEPKAATIFKKHGPYPDIDTQTLNLYTLTAEQLKQKTNAITSAMRQRGYMRPHQQLIWSATFGIKDYEIINHQTHTTRPWRLWHLHTGRIEHRPRVEEAATYMICSIDGTALDTDFRKLLGVPTSTAQILSYGMKNVDFNYLTSNQI